MINFQQETSCVFYRLFVYPPVSLLLHLQVNKRWRHRRDATVDKYWAMLKKMFLVPGNLYAMSSAEALERERKRGDAVTRDVLLAAFLQPPSDKLIQLCSPYTAYFFWRIGNTKNFPST
jgi:hypothetical protein